MNDLSGDIGVYTIHHKAESYPFFEEGFFHSILSGPEDINITYPFHIHDTDGTKCLPKELNELYSEFTATYWIWKNTNHKIFGIYHYRSFLGIALKSGKNPSDEDCVQPIQTFTPGVPYDVRLGATEKNLRRFIKVGNNGVYDIITSDPLDFGHDSLLTQYNQCHALGDDLFKVADDFIKQDLPSDFQGNSFHDYITQRNNKNLYFKCVYYCNDVFFNRQNEFIFAILDHILKTPPLMKKINELPKDRYNRLLAFFSERLTSYFIWFHCIRNHDFILKCVPRLHYEDVHDMLDAFYPGNDLGRGHIAVPIFRLYNTRFADHRYAYVSAQYRIMNDLMKDGYRFEHFIGYSFLKGDKILKMKRMMTMYSIKCHDSALVPEDKVDEYKKQHYDISGSIGYVLTHKTNSTQEPVFGRIIDYIHADPSVKIDHFYTRNSEEPVLSSEMTYEDLGVVFYVETYNAMSNQNEEIVGDEGIDGSSL